jgi:dTDP-glucose pyrophosphorylase
MVNILVLLGGKSNFFNTPEYQFPKSLIEIKGKPMIELVIDNLNKIKTKKKFIFVANDDECVKYHLDNTLDLLTDHQSAIEKLRGETRGAACSALMAVKHISTHELIICNSDQIIDVDFNLVLADFRKRKLEAGVICFESVHPKWSYVNLDRDDNIIETAEKKPISKNAIAGWYYFKNGMDFVKSAMKSVKKDASVNGAYFIAPSLNELVLEDRKLGVYRISASSYHSFYSPQKIKEYEEGHFIQ